MAIGGQENINIGLPNQIADSDSLWQAFNKAQNNFTTLFQSASPITTISGDEGVSVETVNSTSVKIKNVGITGLEAGDNITISGSQHANGVYYGICKITSSGGGGGGSLTGIKITGDTGLSIVPNNVLKASGDAEFSISLATSGVTSGLYSNPTLRIDKYGRITSASNGVTGTLANITLSNGAGIGISPGGLLTSDSTVTITNKGVTKLTVGAGLTLSNATTTGSSLTGDVTLTLTGSGGGGGGTITEISVESPDEDIWISTADVSDVNNQGTYAATITSAGTIYMKLNNNQPGINTVGTLTDLAVAGNAVISGNLTVGGGVSYTYSNTLSVQDPVIEVGGGANGGALTANDNFDRGLLLHYYDTTAKSALMGWDSSSAQFVIASRVTETTTGVYTVNDYGNVQLKSLIASSAVLSGNLNASNGSFTGNVTGANLIATNNVYASGNLIITKDAQVTGNITGNRLIGNKLEIAETAAITSDVTMGNTLTVSKGITAESATISKDVSAVGNITSSANVEASNNVRGANIWGDIRTASQPYLTTLANNLTIGNIVSVGNVTGTGNFTAGNLTVGTGTLTAANATVTHTVSTGNVLGANMVQSNYFRGVFDTLSNAQPNITSTGTLTGLSISGAVLPTANISLDIGNNTNRFRNVFALNYTANSATLSEYLDAVKQANLGNIKATGWMTIDGDSTLTGNTTVKSNLVIDYKTTTNTLQVTSNASIDENLIVTGNITVNNNITVTSGVTANNFKSWNLSNLFNVTVRNSATIANTLTVTANTTVGGNFEVAYNTLITGNANTGNLGTNTAIISTANVTTINSGTLNANTLINLTNTTAATSTTTGALKVSGGAGIGGNLYVGLNQVVTGNITSSGNLTSPYLYGNIVTGTAAPASTAAGTPGQIVISAGYIYVCITSGQWQRAALTGGY